MTESSAEPLRAPLPLNGLRIGTASAPLQIEGSLPPTNWHRWAEQGHIADGSTPDPTTDHWHRWREDNQLMQDLHLQTARIGIEWARIEPTPGHIDHDALARYRDELTDLHARGIRPLVTLHHFGDPLWITDAGGWENPATITAFTTHVRRVLAAVGDLVDDWITINEPNVYAAQGYLWQEAPPGVVSWRRMWTVLRHLAIAHCLTYRILHDEARRAVRVTFAHHRRAWTPKDPGNPMHHAAVHVADHLFHRVVEEAFFRGRFHVLLGGPLLARRHGVRPDRYTDAIGLNYYSRTAISGLTDQTLPGVPVTDLGWEVYPAGMIDALRALHAHYPGPIWITENGCADNGVQDNAPGCPQPTSGVERFRPRFILEHVRAALESELPIEAYFHWCFVDNWEWSEGEAQRFGIVHLDHHTRERTVKPSGLLLRDLIDADALTPELWAQHTSVTYPRSDA